MSENSAQIIIAKLLTSGTLAFDNVQYDFSFYFLEILFSFN